MRDDPQSPSANAAARDTKDLLAAAEAERDRYRLLLEVNNALVTQLDLASLLHAISTALRRVIPHDAAVLSLYDSESGQLRLHSSDLQFLGTLEKGALFPIEGTPEGQAYSSRRPIVIRRLNLDEYSAPPIRQAYGDGVRSACIIPLLAHDLALGTLDIASLRENSFSDEDVELLTHVADQISIAVENALAYREIAALKNKLASEKVYLEEEIQTQYNFEQIIGCSAALKRMLKQVETVAPTDSVVLIYGETGAGKELVARAIHNLSARRERTLVKLNCAAIPTGLLESELFGHEKGAFTGAIAQRIGRFELANKGTLLLDEIGEIPLELQPKLLRVLQEQEFERLGNSRTIKTDVRLIAATNCDLQQMVNEKQFRSDLYYRLNVFPIVVPPLRDRIEDIPLLVSYLAQKHARRMNKRIETIPNDTMQALCRYSWPGNVRELENVVERALILSSGTELQVTLPEMPPATVDKTIAYPFDAITSEAESLVDTMSFAQAERAHILRVLHDSNWVIGGPRGAALKLRLNRSTLRSKMTKLGITRPN